MQKPQIEVSPSPDSASAIVRLNTSSTALASALRLGLDSSLQLRLDFDSGHAPDHMATVTLARHAMATRFEIVLHGDNPVALRAAGEEALEEIERLEAQLSLFRPSSEIAHLNARAAREPVRVTPDLFALLAARAAIAPGNRRRVRHHHRAAGALLGIHGRKRAHSHVRGPGRSPRAGRHAPGGTGPGDFTVRFARAGVMLDLGAIGKGYAIERAAELLREAGVTSALIHGGTSTVYALGTPLKRSFGKWPSTGRSPPARASARSDRLQGQQDARPALLATVPLRDEALSVSAVWGKFFETEGKAFGHILDPRTGQPASQALLAAVVLPSATETDALSTALLTRGPEGHEQIAGLRPGIRTLLAVPEAGHFRCEARNFVLD